MATIKFINSKANIKKIIDYVTNPNKTNSELISGKDCLPDIALMQMQMTKKSFNKENGRTYLHIIQSFSPDDNLTTKKANEIGLELAKQFEGFEVLVATHTDKDHLHNHLVVNSVNFETGLKLHHNKNDLEYLKKYSDKLCLENNLSIITKKSGVKDIKQAEYQKALKGESWKFKLINIIDKAILNSYSKEEFIKYMENKNYKVNWSDNRKYITYTTPEGFKSRDNKLHNIKYTKENMENEFRETKNIKSGTDRNDTDRDTGNYEKDDNRDKKLSLFNREPKYRKSTNKDSNRINKSSEYINEVSDGRTEENIEDKFKFDERISSEDDNWDFGGSIHSWDDDRHINFILNEIIPNTLNFTLSGNEKTYNKKSSKPKLTSSQAKKDYAIKKQTGNSINWEDEDEWER